MHPPNIRTCTLSVLLHSAHSAGTTYIYKDKKNKLPKNKREAAKRICTLGALETLAIKMLQLNTKKWKITREN
jgi:hypothetical protein